MLEDSPLFKVKKIIVHPHKRLSLQSHIHRSEHWTVVSGEATVDIRPEALQEESSIRKVHINESCYIPAHFLHRLSNE